MLKSLVNNFVFLRHGLALGLFLFSVTILAEVAQVQMRMMSSQSSLDAATGKNAVVSKAPKPVNKSHKRSFRFSFYSTYESYLGSVRSNVEQVDPQLVGLGVKYNSLKRSKNPSVVDAYIEIEPNVSDKPYVNLTDLYQAFRWSKDVKMSLGFKDIIWNELDHQWGLGLWQPQVRRDFLNPQQMSLAGLFLDLRQGAHNFTFFVSGLFIPDQGPHFEQKNGEISSKSPWFSGPQKYIDIEGVNTEIHYNVHIPKVEDVIYQPSYGFKYKYNFSKYYWLNMGIANKPMNQLSLMMDHKLITFDASSYTHVNIYTDVVRHNIASLDLGLKNKYSKAWLSYNFDSPIYEELSSPAIERSSMVESQFLGAYLSHRWNRSSYSLRGGFLMTDQKILNKNKDSILENVENSLNRFDYDEFVTLGFEKISEKISKASRIGYGLDYFYSIVNQGGFLKSQLNYKLDQRFSWNVSLKIIGSRIQNNSFYDKYRSNDSVSFGVKYVF